MQLSLENNIVTLHIGDERALSSAQINQLIYFGFRKITNCDNFQYRGEDYFSVSRKLIGYLERQEIKCTFSQNLQIIQEIENQKEQRFQQLREQAFCFKRGELDKADFGRFCSFAKKHIKRKLKEHQIKSAYHHYLLGNSANFSVPGSGKTSTILTVCEKFKQEGRVDSIFVVGPLSSFLAWKNEYVDTLGVEVKVVVLSGLSISERKDIYNSEEISGYLFLITYQTFSNDYKSIVRFFMRNNISLVIDEAHYMKQIGGKWSTALICCAPYAKAKFILTGTPCPKSYADLFNFFDFLWGKNTAISERDKVFISECEKKGSYLEAQNLIKDRLDPLFYRVRKSELGLTEPIFHDPILINMNEIERKIYDSIFNRISKLSCFDDEKNIQTLLNLKRGRMMRLRQMISYPKLLTSAIDNYSEDLFGNKNDLKNLIVNYDKYETSAKLSKLVELVTEIKKNNKKVLIWTNFIGTIALLERELRKKGFKCNHIDGGTPVDEKDVEVLTRERIIKEFLKMESSIDVLIANPGACAESISLHKSCNNAIYFDLSYNCAQYLQSLDRIHRVGGSETIEAHYYFLQYIDTIDDDIYRNLLLKKEKMYGIIEYDSDIYKLDISVFGDDADEHKAYDRIFQPGV